MTDIITTLYIVTVKTKKDLIKQFFGNKITHCRPDGFEYYIIDKSEIDKFTKE